MPMIQAVDGVILTPHCLPIGSLCGLAWENADVVFTSHRRVGVLLVESSVTSNGTVDDGAMPSLQSCLLGRLLVWYL